MNSSSLRHTRSASASWQFRQQELLVLAAIFSVGEMLGIPQVPAAPDTANWQKDGLASLERRGLVRTRFGGDALVLRPLSHAMRVLADCRAQAVYTRRAPGEAETNAFYHFAGTLCVKLCPSPASNTLTLLTTEQALLELARCGEIDTADRGLIIEGVAIESLTRYENIRDALQGSLTFHALRVRQMYQDRPVDVRSVHLVQSPDSTIKIIPGESDQPILRPIDVRWIQKDWDDSIDAIAME